MGQYIEGEPLAKAPISKRAALLANHHDALSDKDGHATTRTAVILDSRTVAPKSSISTNMERRFFIQVAPLHLSIIALQSIRRIWPRPCLPRQFTTTTTTPLNSSGETVALQPTASAKLTNTISATCSNNSWIGCRRANFCRTFYFHCE